MAQQIKKKYLSDNSVDGNKIKLLEGQSLKIVQSGSVVDLLKVESGVVKALGSEIETKASSESKLAEAKAYTDSAKAEIMGGLPSTALDTIKELADQVLNDEAGVVALTATVGQHGSDIASLQSGLASEITARQNADANLQSQISSAVGSATTSISGDLSSETAARIAADSALDTKIESEKTRAMGVETTISQNLANESSARQSADTALSGRITSLENAVPGKANKSYVDATFETKTAHDADKATINAAIAQEVSDRQGAISSVEASIAQEVSNRQSAVASEISARQSAISGVQADAVSKLAEAKSYADSVGSSKLVEAKAYTDSEITKLTNLAPATLDTFKEVADKLASSDSDVSGLTVSLSNEVSRAQGAEAQIASDLSDEIANRQSADAAKLVEAKSYADGKKLEAQSYADSAVAVEKTRAEGVEAGLSTAISNEVSARQSAISTVASNVTTKFNEAKSYADGIVLTEKNRAEAAELSAENNAKAYADTKDGVVITQLTAAINNAVNAEATTRQGSDSVLSSRISTLENAVKRYDDKESFTFGQNGVGLSFVELSKQVIEKSIQINVERMGMNYGEDYSVSVVGGKTRITWLGSVASGGSEAHENGQKCFVTYVYEM